MGQKMLRSRGLLQRLLRSIKCENSALWQRDGVVGGTFWPGGATWAPLCQWATRQAHRWPTMACAPNFACHTAYGVTVQDFMKEP